MATFGPEGPTQCSGLPICRYDSTALSRELGAGFVLTHSEVHRHETPSGKIQQFVYATFLRTQL